ncbi:MAG TPA: 16S rRNA (guanine(966)-N(2))-methyltransferase RsmD [Dehalococcoidales bacterium]|nr:16S rRNA (guanine(966)-N(2))-methyltransferase RsmD [Dehalococcoidales bacterium]
MLRVITGTAKGTLLKVPDVGHIRPATDLVRGAIFSMLENLTDDWSLMLDLFSGSGAFGIEAISRGAGWVDFVDRDRKCCDIIKQNLEKTKFTAQSHVYCTTVQKAIEFLDKEYNIVITDPPYKDTTIGETIDKMADSRCIGENTIVVITHSSRFPLATRYRALRMFKETRHGDSTISIYRKETSR